MYEELEIIKNFIIENNLFSLIIPISLPFILFHFFMKLLHSFTFEIKRDSTKNLFNTDGVEIENNIPDIINDDFILSNNQFIKF